jgi:hypothetical protein
VGGLAALADRKRRRLHWKWLLAGLGLAGITFLVVSWLLFQHVPSWYRPLEVPPDQVQHVQADLIRTTDTLNERMVRANAPFEFQISQDQVNAWLAAREEIWPLSREWLPKGLTDPFITIEPEALRVAASVQWGSVQTVISAQIAVSADEEQIHVRLVEVRGGSLPVPGDWIERQLVRFQQAQGGRLHWPWSPQAGSDDRNTIPLGDLLKGISVPNRGVWRQLDIPPRPFRVIGLKLEPGLLTVTVRPLSERVGRVEAPSRSSDPLQR